MTVSVGHILMNRDDHFRMSAYLQELTCYAGQAMVFEEASDFVAKYLQIAVDAKQIERVCHHYGERIEEQIQKAVEGAALLQRDGAQETYYVMVDGHMLLTREEGWKELKLGRVFKAKDRIEITASRRWIAESTYMAHLGEHDAFEKKMECLIDGLGKKVFVSDGAKWIWNWASGMYPQSLQILDYYHAKEHLCAFADFYFESPDRKNSWINTQEDLFFNDDVRKVIRNIRGLPKTRKRIIERERRAVVRYFQENTKRMFYKTYKTMGLMIGSGPIEAAHRHVIQQRMKRSGQRWTKAGLQQMANLRVIHKSNRWHTVVDMIRLAA